MSGQYYHSVRGQSRARMRAARAGEDGFTLLEMVVAVLILSVLVGLVPRSLVSARALVDRSGTWLQARIVADTVLNQELSGHGLRPGFLKGSVDGRAWTAELRTDTALAPGPSETNRVLLDVTIRVPISGAEQLVVETMRIGSAK